MAKKKKAEPRKAIRPQVIARAKTGLCLIGTIQTGPEPTPICDRDAGTRGLCQMHLQQFWRQKSYQENDPEEYDDKQVENGQILPKQWARYIASNDPFTRVG